LIAFCDSNEFCREEMGKCTDSKEIPEGACTPNPDACVLLYDPVCGCDKRTYGNECQAAAEGVSIDYPGECTPALAEETVDLTTGPPAVGESEVLPLVEQNCARSDDCRKGQFCEKKDGRCDTEGVCKARPEVCMTLYDPVCGCDVITYSNDCNAAAGGTSVAYEGICTDPPEPYACAEGFCRNAEGECQAEARCAMSPCDADPPLCGPAETCTVNYCGGCNVFCSKAAVDATPISQDITIENNPARPPAASTSVPSVSPVASTTTTSTTAAVEQSCYQGVSCSAVGDKCYSEWESCRRHECNCADVGNGVLQYDFCLLTDNCMVPPSCRDGPPEGVAPPSEGTCNSVGDLCDTGIADDYCCQVPVPEGPTYCSVSGGKAQTSSTAASSSSAAPAISAGPNDTAEATTNAQTSSTAASSSSAATAISAGPNDTAEATTNAPAESSVSEEPTPSPQLDFTVQLPTEAAVTGDPTASWDRDPEGIGEPDAPSSGFVRRRHVSFYAAATLLAIAAASYLFPSGDDNGRTGFGKLAVVALAVSSVASRGGVRSRNVDSSSPNKRALQTCNYNVEIMFDACAHSISVSAPHTRTINAAIENVTTTKDPEKECLVEYKADIMFPVEEATTLLGTGIQSLESDFGRCAV